MNQQNQGSSLRSAIANNLRWFSFESAPYLFYQFLDVLRKTLIDRFMKAIDKFGNVIYPSKFSKLKENGKILLANGYFESKSKPNLFCKRIPQGWFYADMRGAEEVPIWEDTRPLFYWNFNYETPKWEKRRLIKKELVDLFNDGCPCRIDDINSIVVH